MCSWYECNGVSVLQMTGNNVSMFTAKYFFYFYVKVKTSEQVGRISVFDMLTLLIHSFFCLLLACNTL